MKSDIFSNRNTAVTLSGFLCFKSLESKLSESTLNNDDFGDVNKISYDDVTNYHSLRHQHVTIRS